MCHFYAIICDRPIRKQLVSSSLITDLLGPVVVHEAPEVRSKSTKGQYSMRHCQSNNNENMMHWPRWQRLQITIKSATCADNCEAYLENVSNFPSSQVILSQVHSFVVLENDICIHSLRWCPIKQICKWNIHLPKSSVLPAASQAYITRLSESARHSTKVLHCFVTERPIRTGRQS